MPIKNSLSLNYFIFRKPNYDIKLWEKAEKIKRSNYYSWELVER